MGAEILTVGFFICMIWGLVNGATPVADQCAGEFQKVSTCLTYATGKANTPSKECCTSASEIKEKNQVCMCYMIQQIHNGNNAQIKSMGIQEAKLLQLPSACNLKNASVADCPQLLHLAPNSPDAAIFTNFSSATPANSAPATSTGTSPTTTANQKSNGFANAVPQLSGLVSIAMAIFFSASFTFCTFE